MSWPDQIDKVYLIVHPLKEKERFERLIENCLRVGIPRERLTIIPVCWGSELTSELIFSVYDPYLQRPCNCFTFKGRSLTRAEISLGLNFYSAVRSAIEQKTRYAITLESDVYLRDDFVSRLADLWKDLEGRTWDYVSLGEGIGTRPPDRQMSSMYAETKAFAPPHQLVFRCTDSMLFNTDYLRKIAGTFIPFREIIDWEMNFQMLVHRGTALWADPPLCEQGTCFNRMVSSLPS